MNIPNDGVARSKMADGPWNNRVIEWTFIYQILGSDRAMLIQSAIIKYAGRRTSDAIGRVRKTIPGQGEVNNKAIGEEAPLLHLWNRQKRRQIPPAEQDR